MPDTPMILPGQSVDAIRLDDTEPGLTPDPVAWFPSLLGQDLGSGFFGMVWLPLWAPVLGLAATRAASFHRREATRTA